MAVPKLGHEGSEHPPGAPRGAWLGEGAELHRRVGVAGRGHRESEFGDERHFEQPDRIGATRSRDARIRASRGA